MQKRVDLFTDFVSHFSDGLILPVVAITALVKAGISADSLIQCVLILIFFYAAIIAVSNYFTRRVHTKTDVNSDSFQNIGLSEELEKQLLEDHLQEQQQWEQVLKENDFSATQQSASVFMIALSHLISGVTVLSPFFFFPVIQSFSYTCILAALLFFIFGFLKGKITSNNPWLVVFRNIFYTGGLAVMTWMIVGMFTS